MGRRGTRHRIARGIYSDAGGIAAVVQVGRLRRERRYPLHTSTKIIKRWQDTTRAALTKAVPSPAARASVEADVARYYLTASFVTLVHTEDRKRALDVWLAVFRGRRRESIRADEIDAALQAWRASGLSASTCSHRLDAISQLFTVLDGKAAANPARGCIRFRKPDPKARALPLELIDRVIDEIPALITKARLGKTIARLRLMRWTGARPSQLRRLTREHFDLDGPIPSVLIPRGKGGKAARIPLVEPEGLDAARAFLSSGCAAALEPDGTVTPARWSCGSTNNTLKRACLRLDVTPFNVYRLRHSVATHLRSAGVPLTDIQDALGHTTATTTTIYAPPVTAVQMAQFALLRVAPTRGTRATE